MSRMHEGKTLLPGWIKLESKKYGAPYFFDTQTGKSLWFPPEVPSSSHEEGSLTLPAQPYQQPLFSGKRAGGLTLVGESSRSQEKRFRPENVNSIPALPVEGGIGLTRVAVIVPYRDLDPVQRRVEHLRRFVPYMETFMGKHGITSYRLYIVEQSIDGRKFNRGKLLNIGFDLAMREGCVAFLFHDVDLLPSDELAKWYSSRPTRPVHVARVWKQYSNNPKYFGGVVAFNGEDFEAINGFPNTFWGWGGEDDEMYSRIMEVGLRPQSAQEGEFTDLEGLGLEGKLALLRKNKDWKCQVKKEALEEHTQTWRQNGLADLQYDVLKRSPLGENSEKVTVDVKANGHWTDTITRWEDLPNTS